MAHGKKTGGRKKGSLNKATVETKLITQETKAAVVAAGQSPLEILLENMRHYQQLAIDAEAILKGKTAIEIVGGAKEGSMRLDEQVAVILAEAIKTANLRDRATACAEKAAPFVHARISPVDGRNSNEVDAVPLAERLKYRARQAAIAAAGDKVVTMKSQASGK